MRRGKASLAIGALVLTAALLFTGRWVASFLADRWWAQATAPGAVPFLTEWHVVGLLLDLAGILVAGVWCAGHALWVVEGIGTVQLPRRVGDLEIREVVSGRLLRPGAMLLGLLLGAFFGAGGASTTGMVLLAWHGTAASVADPILGLDLGVYLAQLPLWSALREAAELLVWLTLAGTTGAYLLVGGIRAGREGLAMTEVARRQVGLLLACALLLATFGEALGPIRAVAGLDGGPWRTLAPDVRWAIGGAWAIAALTLLRWSFHPTPRGIRTAAVLWILPLGVGALIAATGSWPMRLEAGVASGIGRRATGVDQVVEAPATSRGGLDRVQPGVWERRILPMLVAGAPGAWLVAAAPQRLEVGGGEVPAWVALRDDSSGRAIVVVADDRLGPGGGPVSFRDGDPVAYPGIVTWRQVPHLAAVPDGPDTVVSGAQGGIPIGGLPKRIILGWGSQSRAPFTRVADAAALWWRRAPRDRISHLFPAAWWDEPRPMLLGGKLTWVADGWFLGDGAPLAPAIPWEPGTLRYARLGVVALIDGETGTARLYRRPDADAVATAWCAIAGGLVLPPDSIPAGLLEASPSVRWMAVAARALEPGDELPHVAVGWGPRGPVPQVVLGDSGAAVPARDHLRALLFGAPGVAVVRASWPGRDGPLAPRALDQRWNRFATLERLSDSVRRAGGRLETGAVRYDVTPTATQAVRVRWAVSPGGAPTVAWVEVAEGARLGAARTPVTALANLRDESTPMVPAPDLPDPLSEARRWASRADSLLRAGDLEGFARAFAALKRVLGTP